MERPDRRCSLADYRAAFVAGAGRYADAHAALAVWNEAQWHGRECAVALGRLDFDGLERHLEAIETHLDQGSQAWVAWASHAQVAADGMLEPYAAEGQQDHDAGPAIRF
jgi:hypothetical protein